MVHKEYHLYILVACLLILGIFSIHYQVFNIGVPLQPEEKDLVWTVDAKVDFTASKNRPVKVTMSLPPQNHRFLTLNESFISRNFGVTLNDEEGDDNRESLWSIRRAEGKQTLYYRIVLAKNEHGDELRPPKTVYANELPLSPAEKAAAEVLISTTRSQSADIKTFIAETLKKLNNRSDDNVKSLLSGDFSAENVVDRAVRLLSFAHIPGEYVQGILLGENTKQASLKVWLRSHNGSEWLYFDPSTGREGLPSNALILRYGNQPLLNVVGGINERVTFSVSVQEMNALALADRVGQQIDSGFTEFSLYQLPLQTQQIYRVLMMVPLGVLIILALRTFIGIHTFGTFTPVLISLAFRETEVIWGIVLFTFITAMGLIVRSYLEHLKLLLLPRLGIILTVVVVVMAITSIVTFKLGMERGLSIALFPMVILTMTIERMSIVWEERGAGEALTAGIGSLFAAVLAYFAMEDALVQYIVFTFPGTLLLVMAAMILIGRYRGYRLSELFRFQALVKKHG